MSKLLMVPMALQYNQPRLNKPGYRMGTYWNRQGSKLV